MLYYIVTITSHPHFQEFLKDVTEAANKKYNIAIVSLPGSGSTFFIKKIIEEKLLSEVSYITNPNEEIRQFNFLDLDFNKSPEAIKIADEYIKDAPIGCKFAIVINTPELINQPEYSKSIVSNHIFKSIYFPQMDVDRARVMAHNSKVDIADLELKLIVDKTGGVARLIKYFFIHREDTNKDIRSLLSNKDFSSIFLPTITSIKNCDYTQLTKLGIVSNNKYVSELIQEYMDSNLFLKIIVYPNGTIEENKVISEKKYLKHEIAIISMALENEGTVSKEQISEVRWGVDSYESFSDQAIKKIIQRINLKLRFHIFKSIPTIGYQLTNKDV